jgi:L-rhamnose mutarotase
MGGAGWNERAVAAPAAAVEDGRDPFSSEMERICFLLNVKPERLDEYRARHRAVWPEMQSALRDAGWRNYSLFVRDDGLLVGYLETDDFEAAQGAMAATDVNERWQREMAPFFGERPDEHFPRLEEVFHLD